MLRYCTNCKENFEYKPLAVSGKDDLICPKCGNVIGKNSRQPSVTDDDSIEENIGDAIAKLWYIMYMFYITVSIIGIIGFLYSDTVMYISVGIVIIAYIIQLITGTTPFSEGILFLPFGAAMGYFALDCIGGACLGIFIVFLIRHIIRDLLWSLFWKLIQSINKL